MQKSGFIILLGCLLFGFACFVNAGQNDPIAWWKFDEGQGRKTLECISQTTDTLLGYSKFIDGSRGSGLKCDGFTSRIIRKAAGAPRLGDGFTIEAWIAPQAYPWNWCAIVNQEKEHRAGYFFGIDAYGHIGLHLAINGQWQECISKEKIPYMAWSHIAATFDSNKGVELFINGKLVASMPMTGKIDYAGESDLQIGRNQDLLPPTDLVRKKVSFPASYSFDGIIDELKIYAKALKMEEIARSYKTTEPEKALALSWRKWPQLAGPKRFGAVYTRLTFFEEWDALWRVSDTPDIVVHFDELPGKMVFWRGTNYNMNMVTEDARWVGDQSAEGGGGGTIGCCEHMSDKQCRYTYANIIENTDARIVVHWRYALTDVLYHIANTDPLTGWGDWADEFYYIYPDGVAIRYFHIHGTRSHYSITEPATLNQPGERAEDNVNLEAIVLANMAGETRSYTWDPWPGSGKIAADFTNPLANANICVVNFKSNFKPFYIYEPATRIIPYGGGLVELSDFSHFPTWNHWPVSQPPCDGRIAHAADQFTSSAITSPAPPMRRTLQGELEGSFIMGLSDRPFANLAPLARSWLNAAKVEIQSSGFISEGFNKDERAYVFQKTTPQPQGLEFVIAADQQSSLVNPGMVIRNWGDLDAELKIDGITIPRGATFRYGHRYTMEGTDLIVWIKKEAHQTLHLSIKPIQL